jgi:hypothetical protein
LIFNFREVLQKTKRVMIGATQLQRASTLNCKEDFCLAAGAAIAAKVIDVADGDTIRCAIYSPLTGRIVSVGLRIAGVDTAETRYNNSLPPEKAALEKRVGILTRSFVAWLLGFPIDANIFDEDSSPLPTRAQISTFMSQSTDLLFLIPAQSATSPNIITTFDSFGRVVGDISPISRRLRGAGVFQSLASVLLSCRAAKPFTTHKTPWTVDELRTAIAGMKDYYERTIATAAAVAAITPHPPPEEEHNNPPVSAAATPPHTDDLEMSVGAATPSLCV